MRIYKMNVTILAEGESPEEAISNATQDLHYLMEIDGSICGFDTPKSPKFYKEYKPEEVTA